MNPRHALLFLAPFCVVNAVAQTPVPTADRHAYAANTGWLDLRPDAEDGVKVHAGFLSGLAYSANTGWINFGNGVPANGTSYGNTTAEDFGVNKDASGNLTGYAYSANTGWINFGWTVEGAFDNPHFDTATGRLHGRVYSANTGWITLGEITEFAVEFPDGYVQEIVRSALNLPEGIITRTQLATIKSLDLSGLAVIDLGGLEYATNLQTLIFNDSLVDDLLPIANLPVYPSLTVGNRWTGGWIGAPHASNVIQNWLPRRPPETFTAFTTLDTLSVTTSGATVDLNLAAAQKFTFNSPGGTLSSVNNGLTTTEGLNLQAGHLNILGYNDFFGPVNTSVGTTIGLTAGQANFLGTLTNRGEFTQHGAVYARHFTNHGTLTLTDPALRNYFYGTFEGTPGSSLVINSAVAGPDDILPAPVFNNDMFGSFRWSGGGTSTFSIGPRSFSYISLYKAVPGDIYSLDTDNRFTFSDATWNVALNGGFQVISNPSLPYAEVEPQVALSNLTINNQGILRFTADDISFKNLNVTGNPLEISCHSVGFTTTRELSQAADFPGTLRADIFEAFHKFTQPVLEGNIALRLGRKGNATTVELGNLTNSTTGFTVIGSENNTTLVTAAPGAERTLTNTGTLTVGPDHLKIDPTISNSGTINVLGATSAELAKLSSLTGSLNIGIASALTIGPIVPDNITDDTPRVSLTLSSGSIHNQGALTFRTHRLQFFGTTQLTGNPITLEGSILNLAYPVGSSGPLPPASNFEFAAGRNVVIAVPLVPPPVGNVAVPLVPPGSLWRVLNGGYVSSSGLVNAGRIELMGPAVYGSAQPTLHATSEIINTGTVRCFNYGTVQGRLVNQGGITITGTLSLQVDPNETAPNPNRLINYGTVTVDGTLAAYSNGVQGSIEQLGGTLNNNDGAVKLEQGSLFRFGGGSITGHPVELTNATLEIYSTALSGEFAIKGYVNTLLTPNESIGSGVTLRLSSYASTGSRLNASAFTNRGTIIFESTSVEVFSQLTVGGTGLVNEGRIVCAAPVDGNPNSLLSSDVDNKGTFEIQAGAIHTIDPFNAHFHHRGTLTLGPASLLSLEGFDQTFEAHPGSVISGSGRIVKNFAPALLNGQIEPNGTLTVTGDATFGGRLVSRLRVGNAVDRLIVSGALDPTGCRLVIGSTPGFTPVAGVRYVVAQAGSFTGIPAAAFVTPELSRRFRAVADVSGGTMGVTLTAITPGTASFANWVGANELGGVLPANDSDLDHDGTPALIEYAFGRRGDTSDTARTEWSQPAANGNLQMSFPWDNNVRDVTWRLDSAPGAAGPWSPVSGAFPVISAPDANGLRSVSYSLPATGFRSFFRVTVLPGTPPL